MMFRVAYDKDGRILAATSGPEADYPQADQDVEVAELEVPAELADSDPADYLGRLVVDPQTKQLAIKG
jgi:hypothetical protein